MSKVEAFYDAGAQYEWGRLERHRTEFAVNLRALEARLPAPPATVLDIGGGPGRYSIALAQRGYTTTLFDLSAGLLAFAREKANELGVQLARTVHGNALDLNAFVDEQFDAVLLMGPLYHLQTLELRQQAIREAKRVLKPGGMLAAAFINRLGPVIEVGVDAPEWVISHPKGLEQLLSTGTVPEDETKFPGAYFARPEEVRPLLEGEGLVTLDLLASEGVVHAREEKVNALTGSDWETWVDLNYRLCREPSILGGSGHLLWVGRK
jgi:SAM-dependent methyltransferase